VREIRPFRLSESGNLACRQGLGDSSVTAEYFRRLKLINQADFLDLLNWQLTIARRYGPPKGPTMASVLGMKLENLARVMEEAGEVMGTAMLESLMERLQQVLRDTDRCMRGREDVLWILLPQTPAQGLNRLQERLVEGLDQMNGSTEVSITLRFVGCVLPDQALKEEDAALLLARLAGDLS
jgi:GGDEF domain-containing protein